jgi:hypothetical protein
MKDKIEQDQGPVTATSASTNDLISTHNELTMPTFIRTKLQAEPSDDSGESDVRNASGISRELASTNFLEYKTAQHSPTSGSKSSLNGTNTSKIIQRQAASAQQASIPSISSQTRFRPQGVISRQKFDQYVQMYFGVTDVHTGTQSEQEQRLTRHSVPAPTIANWQSWDPGTASEDYTSIIDGMEEMLTAIGAMPQIRTIIFYQLQYDTDPTTGVGIPMPTTGASFGAGELTIYEGFSGSTRPATGLNTTSGAPRQVPNRSSDISYNIVHELGHGVGEAGSNNSRQMFDQFNATVGWIGSPAVLYDMGQVAVQTAVANATALPTQHIITSGRWNDANLIEQPMSQYAVKGGPGEDFAESVAAYVRNPFTLQQRSPRRHQFIHNNIGSWTPRMRNMAPGLIRPPKGDYNLPSGDSRYA